MEPTMPKNPKWVLGWNMKQGEAILMIEYCNYGHLDNIYLACFSMEISLSKSSLLKVKSLARVNQNSIYYSQVPNKRVGWKKCEEGGISRYFFLSLCLFFSVCFPTRTFSTLLVYLAPESTTYKI